MKAFVRFAALALLIAGKLSLGNPPPVQSVQTTLQIVRLPLADALRVAPRLLDETTAVQTYAEIQTGLDSGTVELVAELSGRAHVNERVTVEHVEELRYAIEYEMEDPELAALARHSGKREKSPSVGYPATAFETRTCGTALEVEVSAEGKLLSLSMGVNRTTFEGWNRFETGLRKSGEKVFVEQPNFAVRKWQGPLLCRPGVPQLCALYSLPGGEPKIELHLITANLRESAESKPTESPPPAAPKREEGVSQRAPGIRLEVHQFRVPEREALTLRPQLLDEKRVDRAFARLLELRAAGAAELVQWQMVQTQSGTRAVCENFREARYPIEFTTDWRWPTAHPTTGAGDPPTTIEIRNAGFTSEFEPTWDPTAGVITFDCSIRSVTLANYQRWGAWTDAHRKDSYWYAPNFITRITRTGFSTRSAARLLVSFNRLREGISERGGLYEIVLLRAVATNLPE